METDNSGILGLKILAEVVQMYPLEGHANDRRVRPLIKRGGKVPPVDAKFKQRMNTLINASYASTSLLIDQRCGWYFYMWSPVLEFFSQYIPFFFFCPAAST